MVISVIALTGCASIVSKSKWPVTFKSDPSGAEVVISDENGKEVNRGTTPATITLPAKRGYFASETYQVSLELNGYRENKGIIKADMNGWYFGNILFGGLIGLLVVDPLTGAMWKLPKEYSVNLSKLEAPDMTVGAPPQTALEKTATNSPSVMPSTTGVK